MPVIFDDDNLQVVWRSARSDFLLITFDHRRAPCDGRRFCADHFSKWKSINTLGFIGKGETSFPEQSMILAAEATATIRNDFAETVMIGISMGGYAALKYSRLLEADTIIAAAPSWSYSLADWPQNGAESVAARMASVGIQQDFQPKGMFIGPKDISGNAFVFSDPHEPTERCQIDKIMEMHPSAAFIACRHLKHDVHTLFWTVEALEKMTNLCRMNNVQEVTRQTRALLQSHAAARSNKIRKLFFKHPKMMASLSLRQEDELSNSRILKVLAASEGIGRKVFIMTFHSSAVYFDCSSAICRHIDPAQLDLHNSEVKIEIMGDQAAFFVELDGVRQAVWVNLRGELAVDFQWPSHRTALTFQIVRSPSGIGFSHHNKFLCATPDGHIKFDRDEASIWETFTIGRK